MTRQNALFALITAVVIGQAGCAPRARPTELAALEKLRDDPLLLADDRRAFDLLAAADQLLVRAQADWDHHDVYAARRDALMGGIKMKTALALLQSQRARARIAELDSQLGVLGEEQGRLDEELATETEEVALFEKLRATRAAAAQERQKLAEQMAAASKQAVTERQQLANQLEAEKRRALALDGIRRAELAVRNAETVEALRYAKVKYAAATNMLQEAHKEFDAGHWDESLARTALAQSEAEGGIALARPQYEKTVEINSNRLRDRSLEADATALPGIDSRLERRGDLQRLVLLLGGLFAEKQSILSPAGAKTLDAVKELLAKYPSYPVQVVGFTDDQGATADLVAMALARANAVYWALVTRGIDPKRLNVDSKGAERPIADNATPAGRARNNRIELTILYHITQ